VQFRHDRLPLVALELAQSRNMKVERPEVEPKTYTSTNHYTATPDIENITHNLYLCKECQMFVDSQGVKQDIMLRTEANVFTYLHHATP